MFPSMYLENQFNLQQFSKEHTYNTCSGQLANHVKANNIEQNWYDCDNSLSTDQSDYSNTGCGSNIQLRMFPSAQRRSEVGITAVADDRIEGTEVLILRLILTSATQTAINNAGNIFFQDTLNIRVIDVTGNYKVNSR